METAGATTTLSASITDAPPAIPTANPKQTLRPYVIVTGDLVLTGGMDRANLALAIYLARHGHQVHAVAHRVDPELSSQPNVTFHRVSKPANSYFVSGPLLNRAGRRIGRQIAAEGGRVVVNGGNCFFGDINWVHYVHAAYQPTGVHALARRLKTAYTHRLFLAAEARCLKAARIVIANSNRTKRDLIERVGIAPERIHTVYYGNDRNLFFPPSDGERIQIRERLEWSADRPVVMFIGALGDRRKGFDTLFSAWMRLCQTSSWDADLVVVGRGAELPAWQQRAVDSKMQNRIRFLGFRSDVPDLLRAADVLVAPTRYEAYGLGVQEAFCCGIPAIVSAGAGIAEQYPAGLQSLLLPDCEDAADLASRLLSWRANLSSLQSGSGLLGDRLRSRTWDEMAREIDAAALIARRL
jgi:glycosyltransferase involved in cell wall biosynthesis